MTASEVALPAGPGLEDRMEAALAGRGELPRLLAEHETIPA